MYRRRKAPRNNLISCEEKAGGEGSCLGDLIHLPLALLSSRSRYPEQAQRSIERRRICEDIGAQVAERVESINRKTIGVNVSDV